MSTMKLSDLLTALPNKEIVQPIPDNLEIQGIAHDSRKVEPDDLFIAIEGQATDGHQYIAQVIEKGAIAILGQRYNPDYPVTVPYIIAPDSRAALATMAAAFYKFPAHKLRVIGVTGTDGKTTTVTLIRTILAAAGYKADMITTIGATIDGSISDTGVHVTTPDALEMQRYLAKMVELGSDYAVLETTSHGLNQLRVSHCAFDVAVITNIYHEHLDYHGSYEAYRQVKATLFRSLREDTCYKPNIPKISILNADDSSFEHLRHIEADVKWSYGLLHSADFRAKDILHTKHGSRFTAITPQGNVNIEMALPGEHNVYNALAAIATCYSQGISLAAFQEGLASVKRVTGRLERVDYGQGFDVFVDYAHTPNAIERVLQLARELTQGQVIIICGLSSGLRDRTKRPILGEIVGKLADKIVITAMDWYAEDVGEIMRQIAAGCEKVNCQAGSDYWCLRNRKEGIAFGINLAQPGDTVIIAGKAHERSISYGGVEHPWDEFETVKEALEAKLGRSL